MSELGTVTTRTIEGCHVVCAAGEFDVSNAAELQQAIAAIPADNPVIVDVSEMTFADSAVLSLLVKAEQRLERDYLPLILVVPSSSFFARLLKVSGFEVMVTRYSTTAEALTALKSG